MTGMTEFRPGRFELIPVIIKNLIIINVLVFFAQITFENNATFDIENFFALHEVRSVFFKPHQLITHMFLHGGWSHLFFNMFALWMFGSILENVWGPKRFLTFYVLCGLGAALLHLVTLYIELTPVVESFRMYDIAAQESIRFDPRFKLNVETVGASGAVFGCLAAFGYLFPNSLIYLYFFFPMKAKWFVIIYGAMELWLAFRNSAGDNVAHWAHLGGAVVGFLLVFTWNKTKRRNFY